MKKSLGDEAEAIPRVVVVGSSKNISELGKGLLSFFNCQLLLPPASFASRLVLWKHFISQTVSPDFHAPPFLSLSLAHILVESDQFGLFVSSFSAGMKTFCDLRSEKGISNHLQLFEYEILAHITEGFTAGGVSNLFAVFL